MRVRLSRRRAAARKEVGVNLERGGTRGARIPRAVAALFLTLTAAGCGRSSAPPRSDSHADLRVGIGGLPLQTPERGVQQFIANITLEGLLRVDQKGRPDAW